MSLFIPGKLAIRTCSLSSNTTRSYTSSESMITLCFLHTDPMYSSSSLVKIFPVIRESFILLSNVVCDKSEGLDYYNLRN